MTQIICRGCGKQVEYARDAELCPSCATPLVQPQPAAAVPPGPELDIAVLVRSALAEQQPGEEFESALRRVANDPRGEGVIWQVVCKFVDMQACRQGISRETAAEQLAEADARMKILPDGTPFLETLVVDVAGLASLPEGVREDALRQINESLARGGRQPIVIDTRGDTSSQTAPVAIVAVVFLLVALAYLLSR